LGDSGYRLSARYLNRGMSDPSVTEPSSSDCAVTSTDDGVDAPSAGGAFKSKVPEPVQSLRGSAARGVKWSFVGLAGGQVIQALVLLVLARLIGPKNFGVIAEASVFLAFISLLLDQGIGATIIRRVELTPDVIGTTFLLNLATTIALTALTVACAPLIASFFGTPELIHILRWLAIAVFFDGLDVMPRSILSRRLRFKALASAEVGGATIAGLAGIIVALNGGGYWALVTQAILLNLVVTVAIMAMAGRIPLRGSLAALHEVVTFSSRVLLFSIVNYASRNMDNLLIGRYLGATPLALYSLAYRTLMVPVTALGQVSNRVALPVYARIQDDQKRFRVMFMLSLRLIALISAPLMVLTIIEAPKGVPLFFGDAWKPAVVPLQILALTGLRQSIQSTVSPVLLALGRADWNLRWGLGSSALYVASFIVGLNWGITGVAAAYTAVGFIISPVSVMIIGKFLDFSVWDYCRNLRPIAIATSLLAVVAIGISLGLDLAGLPYALVLVISAICGIVMYVALLYWRWPDELTEAKRFMTSAQRG
jgi:O-antigen/teichoic acid export membrane protein